MSHIANPTDEALQDAVESALRDALGADAAHIGVATERGTVTLTGHVHGETERLAAQRVTLATDGVRAIAADIEVRDCRSPGVTDTELAAAALAALRDADGVPHDAVVVEVRDHVVTLTGMVHSIGERMAAERAITYLHGLERIDNQVSIVG